MATILVNNSGDGVLINATDDGIEVDAPPSGTMAVTEAKDVLAGAGYPDLRGTMAPTEATDTFFGYTTSYLHTGGTGNRTATIAVTANRTLNGGQIDNLVDGGFGANGSDAIAFTNGATNYEIYFDFRSTTHLQIIDEFKWYQDVAGSQGTWKFQGWDGTGDWVDLVTGINLGNAVATQTTSFSNTKGYHVYRLKQTGGTTDSSKLPLEIEFKIAQAAAGTAPSTAYANTGGSGDRRSTIPAISTDATVTSGTLNLYIDGSGSNSTPVATAAGATLIKFDFGASALKIIDQLRWAIGNSTSNGLFKLQASADDSTYIDIGAPFIIDGPAGGGTRTSDQPKYNRKGYRYWRILRIDANTGLLGNVQEFEFQIGDGTPDPLSGTWASTEAKDAFAATGGLLSGTMAVTEAKDTLAAAGYPELRGTMAPTEAKDVLAGSGSLIGGSWHSTEAPDVFSATGPVQVIGTLDVTDTKDTFAASGIPNPIGTMAVSEAKDTFAAAGYPKLRGTMGVTEAKDTFAGSGLPLLTATWASTEAKDLMAGTAVVPSIGTWNSTEAKDIFLATGSPPAALGIDAHATGSGHDTTSATVSITTLFIDDIIVVGVLSGGFFSSGRVTSITDSSGLVWKKRNQRRGFGVNPSQEIWWAYAHFPGARTITVHTEATGFICLDAIAVKGANTTNPWDTHTGAGSFVEKSGNTVAQIWSDSTKFISLIFYGSTDRFTNGTVSSPFTYLDATSAAETNGHLGRFESAYSIYTSQQSGPTVGFGNSFGSLMIDAIVAADQTTSTDDAVRWFFDGSGNKTILALAGTNQQATITMEAFNKNSVVCVAVLINGANTLPGPIGVNTVTDTGGHTWTRRSRVTNTTGTFVLEIWYTQMALAFSGNITVLTQNTQPGDVLSFIGFAINGPDLTLRGSLWDGDTSLPATNFSDSGSYQTAGPFSTVNSNVLIIGVGANSGRDLSGFNEPPYLLLPNPAKLSGTSPPFNIALEYKFSAHHVESVIAEFDASPVPDRWLMIADALPVGNPSPPEGSWHSTEAKDKFGNSGAFTAIGIAANGGWVGYVPATATMAPTEPHDFTTNSGAFTAIWDTHGWIGYVPLRFSFALTDLPDSMLGRAWVIGETTILARWASVEDKDRLGFSNRATVTGTLAVTESKDRVALRGQVIPTAQPLPGRKRRLLIVT